MSSCSGEVSSDNLIESAIGTCHLWHRYPITDLRNDVEGTYKPSHMLILDQQKYVSSSGEGPHAHIAHVHIII